MGVGDDGKYFARSFENHGYYRHYEVQRAGNQWKILGDTERASIEFVEDDKKQVIHWEWKVSGKWLPLCDQIAMKID
jgi:hypothetical protein